MKITLVNSFFPPWRGGAETYVYNLATSLRDRGNDVTIVCGDQPLGAGIRASDGLKVNRLRMPGMVYGTPVMSELLPITS